MSSVYGNRYNRPIGVGSKGFGGAGLNLGLEALAGETDLITIFDDFNSTLKGTEGFGDAAVFEDSGWVLTDVGVPVGDEVALNDPSNVDLWAPSCLYLFTGTADDAGGNMQLDLINGAIGTLVGTANFPHLFIPETDIGAAGIDNTVWVFACRIGLRADLTTTGDGAWDSKAFIGWAVAGDTGLMTAATGALTAGGAAEQLVGFHIPEDGSIDGISQRDGSVAYADGTNFTELVAAGGVDGTVANGAATAGDTMWFDLALRMEVTDWSDNDANGSTKFYFRGPLNRVSPTGAAGRDEHNIGGEGYMPWQEHATVLTNQVPNHTVALVPTIEVINGPTAGVDGVVLLDWWTMGCSRISR